MKFCPNCGAQLNDDAVFCPNCGANVSGNPGSVAPGCYAPVPAFDPYDHTAEFDPKDVSDNKVFAMVPYLMSVVGIIIALLAAGSSPYVAFHVRQALKFTIVEALVGIVTLVLVWTVIVPMAAGIFMLVLVVLQIMMFFSICQGKAKEPAIIRSLNFLK